MAFISNRTLAEEFTANGLATSTMPHHRIPGHIWVYGSFASSNQRPVADVAAVALDGDRDGQPGGVCKTEGNFRGPF